MDQSEEQGTDAASIKPVSSLLSHFEGLKTQQKLRAESPSRDVTSSASTLEAPRPTISVRSSADLVRPNSSWTADTGFSQPPTKTSFSAPKGRMSPTQSAQQKVKSAQTSQQPLPAVNIESPRSPPQTFFRRSASRSPERVDNTPFGKVRELIAQRSSQPTTRSNTPGLDHEVSTTKPRGTDSSWGVTRENSPARQPPPINRADKPKIPAKPPAIGRSTGGSLTPEPALRRPSMDARVSPFSTPPSSGENSPYNGPTVAQAIGPSPFSPAETLTSLESETPDTPDVPSSADTIDSWRGPFVTQKQFDPRMMGFSSIRPNTEQRDPRTLGFASGQNKSDRSESPPSLAIKTNAGPAKVPGKDARDFGFSNASVSSPTRNIESVNHVGTAVASPNSNTKDARNFGFSTTNDTPPKAAQRPLPPQTGHPLSSSTQHNFNPSVSIGRDPRQLGFSTPVTKGVTGLEDSRPSLPMRKTVQEPPPRPSDNSKPGIKQTAKEQLPTIVAKPIKQGQPPASTTTMTPSREFKFPPPPKRGTFSDEHDPSNEQRIKPVQRAATTGSVQSVEQSAGEDFDEHEQVQTTSMARTDYPDATQANRRPPFSLEGEYEINARADPKAFDVCGRYVCVTGYATRVFDMHTGEQIMSVGHGETVKMTAVKFKPGKSLDDEGTRIWLGSNIGDLQEIDIDTQTITAQSSAHNRREIIRILRYRRNLMTLDDEGKLLIWKADQSGTPNMKQGHVLHKVPRGHTFSMMIQEKLFLASGKEIRVYKPGSESNFNVLNRPLSQASTGDITSGAYSGEKGGRVYFGHTDGKVSIYSTTDYICTGVVKLSDYKINSLTFVHDKLWAAYKTGKVYVYDTSVSPWKVKKDWRAHAGPIHGLVLDPSSVWSLQRLQIVTTGHDNYVRMWDATLEEDWIEHAMQERDVTYCTFREVKAAVITWNVGAIVPSMLRDDFIADAIHAEDPPDLVVVGFQEVVDLEDRAVTAKSLLGFAKKKEAAKPDQQHQSRVYREWRDYLARCLSRFTDAQCSYTELHMSSLVGLFQCIFVRQEERKNVSMLSATNVKCGMGGHYGNKGALVTRFVHDDSSICFTNCHLAAGQTQTSHRNNDVATILESESLTAEPNRQIRSSLFVGGGDGTQILDHEICILNGDLNYRIDTIPRDTVIKMIRNNELSKLLERDQLLVSRRRVAGFRLSAFTELPLTFAPTYKYDPGTDNYDSSEKKRSPAWCDRLLYRGSGRVKQIEYRRHEVRASDHRPVSGIFKIRIKKVNAQKRDLAMDECYRLFTAAKKEIAETVCVRWLVDVMGLTENEARHLLVG